MDLPRGELKVLVTGLEGAVSRDVVRLLAEAGACVIVAEQDRCELAATAGSRRPNLIICCCGAPSAAEEGPLESGAFAGAGDVALREGRVETCPVSGRSHSCLVLHAEPLRRCAFDRSLAVLRHPTLHGLLERARRPDTFSAAMASYVHSPSRRPPAPSRLDLIRADAA